jgi:hypothetical protein
VNGAMFDAPLAYDYPRPPEQAEDQQRRALPEVSADWAHLHVRIKPGIYFTDDPAFKGKKRELVAEDYVYSMKRVLDPKLRSSLIAELEPYVLGRRGDGTAARKTQVSTTTRRSRGSGDRSLHVPGEATSRCTCSSIIRDCRISCAVAREVIEH